MPLTVKKVARLSAPGRYGDGHNLYLQINPRGVKSWLLRYDRGGRERWMGLGPLHTIDLAEARERARKARQQLLDGIDPLAARARDRTTADLAAAKALTFEAAARAYFDAHERSWKNAKHRAQFLSTLTTYVFPKIGKLSVAVIDTGLVLKCIEPLWEAKTETANRVRRRIESVLDWATVRSYRTGDNPARWKGHLSEALPARERIQKTEHHAALQFDQLPAFMTAIAGREGIAARALEFAILTAARTGEVTGATWGEINLTEKTWTVPAVRIKGGKEHRVPLSDRAVELLTALPHERGNAYVFIGMRSGGLSSEAMAAVLKRMDRDDITVHGFRSTFRDWAAERTAYPNHVVEMALAHTVGNKVEAAYRRGDLFDKRRHLMAEWARYATQPAASDAVVPLRGRR
jgi:integrase